MHGKGSKGKGSGSNAMRGHGERAVLGQYCIARRWDFARGSDAAKPASAMWPGALADSQRGKSLWRPGDEPDQTGNDGDNRDIPRG